MFEVKIYRFLFFSNTNSDINIIVLQNFSSFFCSANIQPPQLHKTLQDFFGLCKKKVVKEEGFKQKEPSAQRSENNRWNPLLCKSFRDFLHSELFKTGEELKFCSASGCVNWVFFSQDDIQLLKELKVNHYLLSISWPRIMPTGIKGKHNFTTFFPMFLSVGNFPPE